MPTTRKQVTKARKSPKPITQIDGLTPKQVRIVNAKVTAEVNDIPQGVLAQEIYPNATPGSAAVMMSRELKNVNVQDALAVALHKHGISVESVVKVVAQGLRARKVIDTVPIYEHDMITDKSEIVRHKKITVVDHSTRLNAARTAKSLLGLDQDASDKGNTGNTFIFNTERTTKYVDAS